MTHIFGRVPLSAPTFHLVANFVSSRTRTLYFMLYSHPSWSRLSILSKVSTNLLLIVLVSPFRWLPPIFALIMSLIGLLGYVLSIHLFAVECLISFPNFILVTAPSCITCDVEYIRPSLRSCES